MSRKTSLVSLDLVRRTMREMDENAEQSRRLVWQKRLSNYTRGVEDDSSSSEPLPMPQALATPPQPKLN
jgi:hypothetical protein